MDFLKEILGDELYAQVETAINAHNGKPENKDQQIKIADLGKGEYVSKAKYSTLDSENQTNISKLTEANNLIESLKKSAKGDEQLQGQVTEYQNKVQQLEAELAETKVNAAIKVGLLAENATDVDYLTFKLKEKGETIELDEQGNIKGWSDKVAALKTQLPTMFKNAEGPEHRKLDVNNLPQSNPEKTVTREQFLKMGYNERLKLKTESPETYQRLKKG